MQLLAENDENYGDDWIEDISFNVDECSNEINKYWISRRDDPPWNTMSKASIVEEHLTVSVQEEISNRDISDLANRLNKLTMKMGENSIIKEALAAGKHKEIEWQQSIREQTTINKLAQVSSGSKQQRAGTLSGLATPYYNNIMKDQTTHILQGKNDEKKKVY